MQIHNVHVGARFRLSLTAMDLQHFEKRPHHIRFSSNIAKLLI